MWKNNYFRSDICFPGTKPTSGADATGKFEGKLYQYEAGESKMMAEVAVYNEGRFVRFSQVN